MNLELSNFMYVDEDGDLCVKSGYAKYHGEIAVVYGIDIINLDKMWEVWYTTSKPIK